MITIESMVVRLGGCSRIETYYGKADFGPFFRLNSLNTTSIRLIESKQCTQNRFSLATASILGQPPSVDYVEPSLLIDMLTRRVQ